MAESTAVKEETLVINRIIDAPLDLVWRAWTESELVKRWWGPQYYDSPECRLDLRPGGKYLFAMRAPDEQGGQVSYTAGEYLRIVPRELLEFTQRLADKEGRPLKSGDPGMPPDFPSEMRTLVTFEAKSGMTRLVVTIKGMTPGMMMVFALAGWHQSIDKLEAGLR